MTSFRELENYISRTSIKAARADLDATARFQPMVEAYLGQETREIMADRAPFSTGLKYLALLEGSVAAHQRLFETVDRGVAPALGAVASIQVSRRLGEYLAAPIYLEKLYFAYGESPYIGQFLADSYAAAGNIHSLESFSIGVARTNSKVSRATNQDLSRWVNLLADFGLTNTARLFLPHITDAGLTTFLENRIATFERHEEFNFPLRSINLESEDRKWRITSSAFEKAGYTNFHRHLAVPGTSLPTGVRTALVPQPDIQNLLGVGAFACWLSHWKVWETVAEDSSFPFGIILEDDALPFTGPSYLRRLLPELSGFDIVWINRRMSGIAHTDNPEWRTGLLDPWEQLSSWPAGRQGWGADGYLLTRRGAEKLLLMTESVGIMNHVDGQLGAVSTTASSEPSNAIQEIIVDMKKSMSQAEQLHSTALQIPAVRERPFGLSSTVTIDREVK